MIDYGLIEEYMLQTDFLNPRTLVTDIDEFLSVCDTPEDLDWNPVYVIPSLKSFLRACEEHELYEYCIKIQEKINSLVLD